MRKGSKRRCAAEWQRIVAAWEASGLPASAFAARHKCTSSALFWWRWRLRQGAAAASGPQLIQVEVAESAEGSASLEVVTPGGIQLRFGRVPTRDDLLAMLGAALAAERRAR